MSELQHARLLRRLWLVAGLLMLMLVLLYNLGNSYREEHRLRVELNMQEITALNTRLHLDTLLLRHHQQLNYDDLNQVAQEIDSRLKTLEQAFAAQEMALLLQEARQQWTEKQQNLERFKQLNATLGNSEYHFVNLASDLQGLQHRGRLPDLKIDLNALISNMLVFMQRNTGDQLSRLQEQLDTLSSNAQAWQAPLKEHTQTLATHGQLILSTQQRVGQLVQEIYLSPFLPTLDKAYRNYHQQLGQQLERAAFFRLLMLLVSLLLVLTLALIMLRLYRTARSLEASLDDMRRAEARLNLAASVFDNLGEAMTITDARGQIQSVNPAFTAVTGFSEAEAIGHKPGDLLASGQHDATFYASMWHALHTTGSWQGEIFNRRKNGEVFPEWLSITAVRNAERQVVQYIALFSDITERKEAEAYIHHLAYHDPLTGLANRLLFNDRLDQALKQVHRTRRSLAVLMFDLDRFKSVNDSLGHSSGDKLLREVAQRFKSVIREGDTLARLGGDEFALLMSEIRGQTDAASLAASLLSKFEKSIELDGHEIFTSTSIGIAIYPQDGETAEELIRHADLALYAAKDAGRAGFRFHVPGETPQTGIERLDLESALRHVVIRNQLLLYYQPQVDAKTGRILSVEALLRWQHPMLGLVPPGQFIPIAESSNLINPIGAWCLRTACAQMVAWRQAGIDIGRVAVNVSVRQLRQPTFAADVLDIIDETGIDPQRLELELTESMLSEDTERTFHIFTTLREHGVRIAIDDFGTGYSSLSYLARYPVDIVKIDQSFVRGLAHDVEARSIVQAIILLAHGLRMETIAEGVETEVQRQCLTQLGCDSLQGYLFARPNPMPDLSGTGLHDEL
jgi:diguanylate cyclase (GGDEF)-like protein/PAS domain S-box-containing protein